MITAIHLAFLIFIAAMACSSLLTYIVKKHSQKTGFVSIPREDRYNRNVIALGGGVAIFWTLLIFMLGGVGIVKFLIMPGKLGFVGEEILVHKEGFLNVIPGILTIAGCASALHILGYIDDKKHLGPYLKLAAQILIATFAAVFADIRVEFFIHNQIITTALSVLWIVLIMNAFNFLDNMDGLSVGIAFIASAVLLTAAVLSGQYFIGALTILFMGSLAGFLLFNFPPASIFMGDCGSLVVGFFVALITLKTTYYHEGQGGGLYAVFMPIIVLAVPLYDFASVTVLRISQGKSPFVGDTQHFSHRLKRRGLTDMQVALTLYLATICTGIGAISLFRVGLFEAILVFAQTIMILAIIAILEMTGKDAAA